MVEDKTRWVDACLTLALEFRQEFTADVVELLNAVNVVPSLSFVTDRVQVRHKFHEVQVRAANLVQRVVVVAKVLKRFDVVRRIESGDGQGDAVLRVE